MGHSKSSNTTLGRCFPEQSWQCSPRPPPTSASALFSLLPLLWLTHLLILLQSRLHERQVAISHVGHWSWICPHLWPSQQCEAQGKCEEFSCPPTNADFLEVGVLPQQLSNHIGDAACYLPMSPLKAPPLGHVIRLPPAARGRLCLGGRQGSLCGLITIRILCILFFS